MHPDSGRELEGPFSGSRAPEGVSLALWGTGWEAFPFPGTGRSQGAGVVGMRLEGRLLARRMRN